MPVVFSLVTFCGDEFKSKWSGGGEKQFKKVHIPEGTYNGQMRHIMRQQLLARPRPYWLLKF